MTISYHNFGVIIIFTTIIIIVYARWHWTQYRFWGEMATWMIIPQVLTQFLSFCIIKITIIFFFLVTKTLNAFLTGRYLRDAKIYEIGAGTQEVINHNHHKSNIDTYCLFVWQIRKLIIGRAINAEYRDRWQRNSFETFWYNCSINQQKDNEKMYVCLKWGQVIGYKSSWI